MSIEVILVPLAIGLTSQMISSCISGSMNKCSLEKELQKGAEYVHNNAFFTTKINDNSILRSALEKLEYKEMNYKNENYIEVVMNGFSVRFDKNKSEVFKATFSGNIDQKGAQAFLDNLYLEYTKGVQQAVYYGIMEKAKNRNIKLESEEVLDDNSILLTFDIDKMF